MLCLKRTNTENDISSSLFEGCVFRLGDVARQWADQNVRFSTHLNSLFTALTVVGAMVQTTFGAEDKRAYNKSVHLIYTLV